MGTTLFLTPAWLCSLAPCWPVTATSSWQALPSLSPFYTELPQKTSPAKIQLGTSSSPTNSNDISQLRVRLLNARENEILQPETGLAPPEGCLKLGL